MATIRVGGIGTGARFRGLSEMAVATDGMELVALCDLKPENIENTRKRLARDLPAVSDYKRMLGSPDVDAVIITTPNAAHAQQAVDALAAGKHVLCEKPMATTVADAARIVEAAEKSDKVMMVGLQMRHHAWCRAVNERVTAGKIGTPRMAWCTEWRGPFALDKSWVFTQAFSGGAIVEKNCHHFDLFNWWTSSRPARVAAFGGIGSPARWGRHSCLPKRESDIVDHAYVIAEQENHVRTMVGVCFFGSHGVGRDMGITGDEGTLLHTRRDLNQSLTFYPREGEWERIELDNYDGGNERIMARFRDAILGKADPFPTSQMGYDSILAPIAAEIAIKEKRVVTIAEVEAR